MSTLYFDPVADAVTAARAQMQTDLVLTSSDRLEARKEIRQKLAQVSEREREIVDLQALVSRCNSEIDRAVEEHVTACAPLQEELRNATAAARVMLLEQLEAQNAKLQTLTSQLNQRIATANGEISRLAMLNAGAGVLKTLLYRHGDRNKLDQHWVAQQAVMWGESRLTTARKRVESLEAQLAYARSQSTIHAQQPRGWAKQTQPTYQTVQPDPIELRRWQAEQQAASEALADAQRLANDLYGEIIDE
jgi:hypothetical protein